MKNRTAPCWPAWTAAPLATALAGNGGGLSVGVLTYYMVSLLHHLLAAVESVGVHLNVELLTGIAIPLVALLVWFSMHKLKASLGSGHKEL
jgi:uncharacterized membrane-anchored protein